MFVPVKAPPSFLILNLAVKSLLQATFKPRSGSATGVPASVEVAVAKVDVASAVSVAAAVAVGAAVSVGAGGSVATGGSVGAS